MGLNLNPAGIGKVVVYVELNPYPFPHLYAVMGWFKRNRDGDCQYLTQRLPKQWIRRHSFALFLPPNSISTCKVA